MRCLPKKIICNDQSGPFNVVWYCCYFSVQLRDREHQIRRMESEQEDLNKKLAVSKTEKFLMYISNTTVNIFWNNQCLNYYGYYIVSTRRSCATDFMYFNLVLAFQRLLYFLDA